MSYKSPLVSDYLDFNEPPVPSPEPVKSPKRRYQRQLSDRQNTFKCVDCKNEVTFSRKSDLERHERLKHSHRCDEKRFVCCAQGCFRGQMPWTFARSDKLTSHIKTTHNQGTIFGRCPIKDCNFGPSTLEILGAHIRRAHQDDEAGRAVLNATSCKALRCPLWRCGKHVSVVKLLNHITSHAREEIEAAKPSLELVGLLVQCTCEYDITIKVICPVCQTASANMKQFIEHLSSEHLYTPSSGDWEHFELWRAYLGQHSVTLAEKLLPWSPIYETYLPLRKGDIACPSCPFSVANLKLHWTSDQQAKESPIREHHLSLLRPEAEVIKELYPHRMQILRLWPEFVTHPVFADLDHPQQESESGPSQTQPSFLPHVNNDFQIPDWTTYDFNIPM
jgi:hypothetical protein